LCLSLRRSSAGQGRQRSASQPQQARFGAHTEHLARSSAATAAAPDQLASARTCSGCARLLAPRARPERMGRAQRPALRRAHAARRCQRQRQCTAQPRAYQATRCSLTRPAALGKPPAETQADRSYPPMTQHRSSRRALPSPERATVGAAGPAGAPAAARHPVPAALASCMSTHARRTGRGMQADSFLKPLCGQTQDGDGEVARHMCPRAAVQGAWNQEAARATGVP
jgi:hypothetical protein